MPLTLQEGDPRFQGLLEAAPDAIVCVDAEGRIALLNAQAERLFGYKRDELIGRAVEDLVPEGGRRVHSKHRQAYFADPVTRPMGAAVELAGRRKDGTQFPAEISLAAIETEEGVLVYAAIRNVSERLEAQAERERRGHQLHQSQRLEGLGQLAGGVAHDFNNLLGVVLNYTALVEQEIAAQSVEDPARWEIVRKDLAEVRRAAQRATKLTHQLLAFGRREVAQPVALSLNDVAGDIERLLKSTLGERIELVTSLSPDLWAVLADPGQIEEVLVNLALNARDAMSAGGRLMLETVNVAADDDYILGRPALTAGRYTRLRVSDTGCGMDTAIAERAFDPFFTTKPKGEGSGLGLATAYGIVKQAGGELEISSEVGVGTTISVLLPATEAPPAVGEAGIRILAGNGYAAPE